MATYMVWLLLPCCIDACGNQDLSNLALSTACCTHLGSCQTDLKVTGAQTHILKIIEKTFKVNSIEPSARPLKVQCVVSMQHVLLSQTLQGAQQVFVASRTLCCDASTGAPQ